MLCRLVELCLQSLRWKTFFWYTALCTINRIVDLCFLFHFDAIGLSIDGLDLWDNDEPLETGGVGGAMTTFPYFSGLDFKSLSKVECGHSGHHCHLCGGGGSTTFLGNKDGLLQTVTGSLLAAPDKSTVTPRRQSVSAAKHEKIAQSGSSVNLDDSSSSNDNKKTVGPTSALAGAVSSLGLGLLGQTIPGATTGMSDKDPHYFHRSPLSVLFEYDQSVLLRVFEMAQQSTKSSLVPARQKCTPSTRIPSCPHCMQILSARLMTIISHSELVQKRLVQQGQIRIIVDSLDLNFDPV